MTNISQPKNRPLLKLISSGFRLWILSNCKKADSLKLEFFGDTWSLLKGKIEKIQLSAINIKYNEILYKNVEIESDEICFSINTRKKGSTLLLKKDFKIDGHVYIGIDELNSILSSDKYSWLGDYLSDQLIGITPLNNLSITNNMMELQAQIAGEKEPMKRLFKVKAQQGKIRIYHEDINQSVTIPMETGVYIKKISLTSDYIKIEGSASVTI